MMQRGESEIAKRPRHEQARTGTRGVVIVVVVVVENKGKRKKHARKQQPQQKQL